MKPSKVNAGGSGGKIHVIGIAPGRFTPEDEFLLRFISEADLLIGRREYLARWPGIPSIELGKDLGKALELAEMNRAAGKLVVFLASGDPLFFGIGGTLCKRLGPDKVRVHPSISSMQLAFSRIGESWDDARFLSA
ncbi:MAG: precorrin-6y C5,15-methyltransferase (decarboxylating) subunit CbiE, partial [Candidatus Geothermincolales bacterium]